MESNSLSLCSPNFGKISKLLQIYGFYDWHQRSFSQAKLCDIDNWKYLVIYIHKHMTDVLMDILSIIELVIVL